MSCGRGDGNAAVCRRMLRATLALRGSASMDAYLLETKASRDFRAP